MSYIILLRLKNDKEGHKRLLLKSWNISSIGYAHQKQIDAVVGMIFLGQLACPILEFMLFDTLFEKLAFVDTLLVENLLFLNRIESNVSNLHTIISIGLKSNRIRFYGVMRYG